MDKKAQQKAKSIGRIGEESAGKYLAGRGYLILCVNFHSKFGEIDIIAEKNREIIFVEVKTRTNHFKFGHPEEALTYSKYQKIRKTIYEFFYKFPSLKNKTWRIDLIAVALNSFEETKRIVHYKNVEI